MLTLKCIAADEVLRKEQKVQECDATKAKLYSADGNQKNTLLKRMTFADKITGFLFNLQFPIDLPNGIEVMNPFTDKETKRVCNDFYHQYYNDEQSRFCIIGINPGRFGAGVTGVPFTDPIRLANVLNIQNEWAKKQELSSLFIYDMIAAFGGAQAFYSKFYITAVSPLGFVRNGKNLNYYDDKGLQESIKPFVVDCFEKQLAWGLQRKVAFCLGEGKNNEYLQKLSKEYKLFDEIIPLSHPRFIMQYKLKQKETYIDKYLTAFSNAKVI